MRRICSFFAVLLASGLFLGGCGPIEQIREWLPETGKETHARAEKEEQVLRLTTEAEPPNLDSAEAIDGNSFNVLNNVMEGLMRLDQDNKPQPAMAEDFEVSDDKKTYTFQIREGARWSDGKPVTAQDFEYAWKRALDPEKKLESAYILFPLENARAYYSGQLPVTAVGVKALDDRTLRVRLDEPVPYFLSLTASAAYYPQRKDIIEKFGSDYAKEEDKMVYNGPFVLKDWEHEQSYRLVKNESYWDAGSVKLDEAQVRIIPDSVEATNLYTSGEVDMAPLSDSLVQAFKGNPEFVPVERGATFLLLYNTNMTFFSNTKIRKAFSLAIDREQLVQDVLKNGSRPAKGMVPDSISGYNDEPFRKQAGKLLDTDVEEARRLLKEGMQELGISYLPQIELNVNDDDRKKIALNLKQQLKSTLGVDIVINPKTMKQKLKAEQAGYFHLSLVRWIGRYNDPMAFLEIGHSQSRVNLGRWSDPTFDKLIVQSKFNTDLKKRDTDLAKAEEIVMNQAGVSPLFYETQAYIQKPYVKNLYRSPVGAEYTLKWVYIDGRVEAESVN
ncbi:oligopeptide transport system substrate-binding protein [Melghirimyces profundicolus]|uniref:Oligopeptide transport system substrate-binding protein n=1 Tax=Melghirimyces profundicolus TaxID=1242148 RepID=A0A2T6C7I0_9BACL|nr:peptide ABC transporter substrate-binding protein [Melghirimyces profundicolus]PTX64291.1 oligopeptide transport system substrate-binding protein [Melghirimyces profundicolus]